jgi:hypothetical protein
LGQRSAFAELETVRSMEGLVQRGRRRDLFERLPQLLVFLQQIGYKMLQLHDPELQSFLR